MSGVVRRHTLVTAVIPLLTWTAAGVANASGFIMGGAPTAVGVVATLVAVCTWLGAGWFAGSRSNTRFVRVFSVFWAIVVGGTPLASWALTVAPGRSAGQGGIVLPIFLFAFMAPLYGLYALLPPWEPIVQVATVGAAVFAMILIAYFVGRRKEPAHR